MPAETDANRLAWPEPDQPDRRGGAVLLVVGVQDEQQVERPRHRRVDVVGLRGEAERHPEEVLDQPQAVVGVQERLARRTSCRRTRRSWAAWRAGARSTARSGPGRGCSGCPGRRSTAPRPPRRAPASGARRAGSRRRTRLRSSCSSVCRLILLVKSSSCAPRRQLAVDQQVAHLEEAALLGELLDRVAAVAQDAGVAVDVGDRGRRRGGVDEAGVERDVARSTTAASRRRCRTRPRSRGRPAGRGSPPGCWRLTLSDMGGRAPSSGAGRAVLTGGADRRCGTSWATPAPALNATRR